MYNKVLKEWVGLHFHELYFVNTYNVNICVLLLVNVFVDIERGSGLLSCVQTREAHNVSNKDTEINFLIHFEIYTVRKYRFLGGSTFLFDLGLSTQNTGEWP